MNSVGRKPATIRAITSHRIYSVRNCDDARKHRDSLTSKGIRIATSVPGLVMMSDRFNSVAQVRRDTYQLCALKRMRFHDCPFFSRQLTGFGQNWRKDLMDLADIVQ